MSEVEVGLRDGVLTVTFDRPDQRNAMTWAMYDALVAACDRADADDAVRVLVLRGAGGRAFVAGTDITQFRDFEDGDDGVAYERRVGAVLRRLRLVRVPSIAAVEGACVGGGLGIACAADLRLATPGSRFGVPIARTVGNCLSRDTLELFSGVLGRGLTLDLVVTGRLLDTDEAARCPGFLHRVVDDLDEGLAELTERVAGNAPLTMWAAKQLLGDPAADEHAIVSRVYGSADFRARVERWASPS